MSQALEALLHDAEAQLGAIAVETLRQSFAAVKDEFVESCRREQALLDECAALEERREKARLEAAAAPPEPDDADSMIAVCRSRTSCHLRPSVCSKSADSASK